MSTCGGSIATNIAQLPADERAVQVAGALDARTRLTIRAGQFNPHAFFIVPTSSTPAREGFPLYPGEAYQFDDRGARAAVWLVDPYGGGCVAWVISEGA